MEPTFFPKPIIAVLLINRIQYRTSSPYFMPASHKGREDAREEFRTTLLVWMDKSPLNPSFLTTKEHGFPFLRGMQSSLFHVYLAA